MAVSLFEAVQLLVGAKTTAILAEGQEEWALRFLAPLFERAKNRKREREREQ